MGSKKKGARKQGSSPPDPRTPPLSGGGGGGGMHHPAKRLRDGTTEELPPNTPLDSTGKVKDLVGMFEGEGSDGGAEEGGGSKGMQIIAAGADGDPWGSQLAEKLNRALDAEHHELQLEHEHLLVCLGEESQKAKLYKMRLQQKGEDIRTLLLEHGLEASDDSGSEPEDEPLKLEGPLQQQQQPGPVEESAAQLRRRPAHRSDELPPSPEPAGSEASLSTPRKVLTAGDPQLGGMRVAVVAAVVSAFLVVAFSVLIGGGGGAVGRRGWGGPADAGFLGPEVVHALSRAREHEAAMLRAEGEAVAVLKLAKEASLKRRQEADDEVLSSLKRRAEAETVARRAAEEDAAVARRQLQEAEARKIAEEEAREAARKAAEEEAARVAAEEAARRAAEEEAAQAEAEEAARRAAEEEAARAAAEEAARRAAEEEAAQAEAEEAARRAAEEEAAQAEAEEAARRAAEEEATRAAAEEAARRAAEEEATRAAAEEAARRAVEEEAARVATEEADRKAAKEAARVAAAAEDARKAGEEALKAAEVARMAAEQAEAHQAAEEDVRKAGGEAALHGAAQEGHSEKDPPPPPPAPAAGDANATMPVAQEVTAAAPAGAQGIQAQRLAEKQSAMKAWESMGKAGIEEVLKGLRRGRPAERLEAAILLAHASPKKGLSALQAGAGCTRSLVELIGPESPGPEHVEAAARALRHLAGRFSHLKAMVADGLEDAIPRLAALLECCSPTRPGCSPFTAEHAAGALFHLAGTHEAKKAIWKSGAAEWLVRMMGAPEVGLREQAAAALWRLVENSRELAERKAALAGLGAPALLRAMVETGAQDEVLHATRLLGIIGG